MFLKKLLLFIAIFGTAFGLHCLYPEPWSFNMQLEGASATCFTTSLVVLTLIAIVIDRCILQTAFTRMLANFVYCSLAIPAVVVTQFIFPEGVTYDSGIAGIVIAVTVALAAAAYGYFAFRLEAANEEE